MISPLKTVLDELRNYLQAQPVTLETLPSDIARQWVTQDGRFKVEILPKGDPNDNETLRKFALAVLAVEPECDRRSGFDPRIRLHRSPGILRGGLLGARSPSRFCCGSCCAVSATSCSPLFRC